MPRDVDFEYGPESPYFDDYDEDGELYPPDYSEKLNHEKNRSEGDPDDWDRLMDVSAGLNSGELNGRAPGKQIVGTMAVVLDTNAEYEFSVKFTRLPDDEELPEGWAE